MRWGYICQRIHWTATPASYQGCALSPMRHWPKLLETGRAPQRVNLAGSVTSKQIRVSQRGNRFAFVQLTDQTGVFEVTMFSDVLAEAMTLLESENRY